MTFAEWWKLHYGNTPITDGRDIGIAAMRAWDAAVEACAKKAEGWCGRRLEGHDPESETGKAFGRGVDMASYYIAAAIREREG